MARSHSILTVAALTLCAATSLPAQQLTPVEQRIRTYLQQHQADEIALLAKSVDIKSQTLDLAGVRAVGQLFAERLAALGFHTRCVPMPASMHRAGHLVAERKGNSGKRLLLIGLLDTVVEGDSLNFARIDSATARGAGSSDMKGGDVEIIEALDALNSVGALANKTITVVMTGDEEAAGDPLAVARAPLIDAARHSDIALAFEGGNPHDATVARRGASSWLLTVHGRGSHSAGMFGRGAGYGAIYEAARIIN